MTAHLAVGDTAPDFALPSQRGGEVRFSSLLGGHEIVLYFYPKDNTPGCTAEAKAFRDRYDVFRKMGAEVIGISSDSVDTHADFAARCELPFTLLSDPGGKVRKLYGVPSTMGLLPGRVTYIIDGGGVVRHIFNSQFNVAKHVDEAINVLKSIRAEGQSRPSEDAPT